MQNVERLESNGIFITFKGLDGSGKTTQLRLLENELKKRGRSVVSTCEPGGTLLGKRLRELILDDDLQVAPLAELLLFAADRAQHIQTLIHPALKKGQIVISDRYSDATVAYQGAGRGVDARLVKQLVKLATDGLKPNLTLFFDLPVTESLKRTNSRAVLGQEKNRMDKEDTEFYTHVRDAYLQIARREKQRFRVVDATASPNEIHAQVIEIVDSFLH
ncbi:MAG: dTMP kinase [Pyrinomonadaceae bacterium]